MTLGELKIKLDEYIGIMSLISQDRKDTATLIYKSPTGVIIGKLSLYYEDISGKWCFSSKWELFPDSWQTFCKISK